MTVDYLAAANAIATTQASAKRITIPGPAVAGTFLLLEYSGSQTQPDGHPTGVTGWNQLDQQAGGTCYATWWWKIAEDGDAGATVTIPAAANAKTAMTMLAFSNVDPDDPIAAHNVRAENANDNTHDDPATLSLPGGFSGKIIRCLALKDNGTISTTWTPSAGTIRATANTGGSYPQVAVAAARTSDTDTYSPGAWTVTGAGGAAISSPNAVTLALALREKVVAPPATQGVRDVMTGGGDGGSSPTTLVTLALPVTAQEGDTALVMTAANLGDTHHPTPPAGWAMIHEDYQLLSTYLHGVLFAKTLTAADIATGTVDIRWDVQGRLIAGGIVLYGLDPIQPVSDHQVTGGGGVASYAAPSVTTVLDDSQVVQFAIAATGSGSPSEPSWPAGWTRRVYAATNYPTSAVNTACAIATLDTPGAKGSYGGETVGFSGTGPNSIILAVATQTEAQGEGTSILYQRWGDTLRPVRLAKVEGTTVILL